jgi:diacylglycerol kinase (ATP)
MHEAPARHAWIIRNPSARRALPERRLREAAEPLRRRGWQIELRSTRGPGEAQSLAREAATAAASAVVAAGGDGTIHEVVNGLAGSGTALGVVACGTANVWAGEAGLPASPERALALVANGWRARLDLGEVEGIEDLDGTRQLSRYFLLMCGLGLDGTVVRAMHGRRSAKRLLGRAAFAPAIARTAFCAQPLPVRITAGRRELHRELLQAVAGNTRGYGGLLRLTGDARADDGMLDLLVLSGAGRRRQAELVARALRGGLHRRRAPGVDYLRESTLAITLDTAARAALEVQADGEHLGAVPPGGELRLRTARGTLVALLPRRASAFLAASPPPSSGARSDEEPSS